MYHYRTGKKKKNPMMVLMVLMVECHGPTASFVARKKVEIAGAAEGAVAAVLEYPLFPLRLQKRTFLKLRSPNEGMYPVKLLLSVLLLPCKYNGKNLVDSQLIQNNNKYTKEVQTITPLTKIKLC